VFSDSLVEVLLLLLSQIEGKYSLTTPQDLSLIAFCPSFALASKFSFLSKT
jgi:hypothetical protein